MFLFSWSSPSWAGCCSGRPLSPWAGAGSVALACDDLETRLVGHFALVTSLSCPFTEPILRWHRTAGGKQCLCLSLQETVLGSPHNWGKHTAFLTMSPLECAFATADEPALAHRHSEPRVILGLTLGVLCSLALDRRIVTCVSHCRITQNSLTALRMPCARPARPHSLPTPQSHGRDLFTLSTVVFSRMSRSWNHTLYSILRLASVT